MLLNNQWIAEEIKQEKKKKKKLETNVNETTTFQNLQDTVEPVPRQNFIAIHSPSSGNKETLSHLTLYQVGAKVIVFLDHEF